MRTPEMIIEEAIKKFKPAKYVLLVSGGHDSITNAHMVAGILKKRSIQFCVYHGDTTIGIPETQEYVKMICILYGWELHIRRPPNKNDWYENIIAKHGFPGPTKTSHQYMYRRLKERALRNFVTHEMKSGPYTRENVLLFSGVRKEESRIRMGYKDITKKEDSRIWCNPLFYWSEQDCKEYMKEHFIPLSPVKEKICISGECLCGCFAKKEELIELKRSFPNTYAEIMRLQSIAELHGFPWGWASGPNEWKANKYKKQQLKMNFMCVGCDKKSI